MFKVARLYPGLVPRLTCRHNHTFQNPQDPPRATDTTDVMTELKETRKSLEDFRQEYKEDSRDNVIFNLFVYIGLVFIGSNVLARR